MVFLMAMPIIIAQEYHQLNKGDIVTLGYPNGPDYQYLDFPRKNIIIKRGAIPTFNALIGKKLVVDQIETDKKGKTRAVLRRKDGLNFFKFYPTFTADVEGALADGELRIVKPIRED